MPKQQHSEIKATGNLRFVERGHALNPIRILQQEFHVTTWTSMLVAKEENEWRDVPLVKE